ncbi:MAG: hypothetical protein JWP27_62 [Flaviaesturariibacter sp.]|nr:hypothetical protein [Flaviaesturariibacter sp.]
MDNPALWLTRLILAHLLTDFVLQPKSWIDNRTRLHFASPALYAHGLLTALLAWTFLGFSDWWAAVAILITHLLIDGWKSYRPAEPRFFLIDQGLHLAVLLACWCIRFGPKSDVPAAWEQVNTMRSWVLLTAFVFLTLPAGILIGQLTQKWRAQIQPLTIGAAESLAQAGKVIGIIERIIIIVLVLKGQYEAIGLLIATKGIIRFGDTNRTEAKTEYLVIGTLLSMTLAISTGLGAMKLIAWAT